MHSSVEFWTRRDYLHWIYTNVHGPNSHHLKATFWEELQYSKGHLDMPWVICDDFNALFTSNDKMP